MSARLSNTWAKDLINSSSTAVAADVTVVGGGIAGLTAAITAAEEGCRVQLYEERATLGGRAQTTGRPYLANLGGHALYSDGTFWDWLAERRLLPATVDRGSERLHYRRNGQVSERLTELGDALNVVVGDRAPVDISFRDWAERRVGSVATGLLIGFASLNTFEADAGRLSAAFVNERLRRTLKPNVARYVVGGWERLVRKLADRAASLGVSIETRQKVTVLPAPPVVIATAPAAARRLLREAKDGSAQRRVFLYDLAVGDEIVLPSGVLDLDEGIYIARYTAFDRSLAPPSEELIQISCGCRPGERLAEVQARIELVLDSIASTWRRQLRWSRRSLLAEATGAVDLPGCTWRDRPSVFFGRGIYRAGDYVAAPGLLSEVSFSSGREAGLAAAALVRAHRGPGVVRRRG